ncbi:hypothetical protein HYQ46_005534 [Verticillium longisporum]|nr:hypothetical protein HYQ46_005534 [Verticillium longisporum]
MKVGTYGNSRSYWREKRPSSTDLPQPPLNSTHFPPPTRFYPVQHDIHPELRTATHFINGSLGSPAIHQ